MRTLKQIKQEHGVNSLMAIHIQAVEAKYELAPSRRIDVEDLILKCVPGGDICDPQQVADAIREYLSNNPVKP